MEVPWEKVPFVPRPSLIADPITAFGKRKTAGQEREAKEREGSIVLRLRKDIKPKPEASLAPLQPYKSPRDLTRERVFNEIHRQQNMRESGGIRSYMTDQQSLDVLLPRLHGKSQDTPKRTFRTPIY